MLEQPSTIPQPWAEGGSKAAIPNTTTTAGRASWEVGFPQITATPLSAGGIPPHWLDFQGVLYALSLHIIFAQEGGNYKWVSGKNYGKGATVTDDTGKLYFAIKASGPGTEAGSKNPATAANREYWGRLATPDGSTIKVNSDGTFSVDPAGTSAALADGSTIVANNNGKLSVGAQGTSNLLADGTTIIANNGKLSAVNQGGDASALADGQTIIAANGKLSVNYGAGLAYDTNTGKLVVTFQDLTTEQILALCDPGGGITATPDYLQEGDKWYSRSGSTIVEHTVTAEQAAQTPSGFPNPNANTLMVDFESMPQDVKDDIIKGLSMQIPLTSNKTFYVDGTPGGPGSDTLEKGIGESTAKPFLTLQACVSYVTNNYSLGEYNVTIRCKNVSTTNPVVLPDYTHSSGNITIAKYTSGVQESDPSFSVNYAPTSPDFAVSVSGGEWRIYDAVIQCTNASITSGGGHIGGVIARAYSELYLYRTSIEYTNAGSVYNFAGQHCLASFGNSIIHIGPGITITASDQATPAINGMTAADSASTIRYDSDDSHTQQLTLAGSFNRLVFSTATWVRNGVYLSTVDVSGVTSTVYKYYANAGGHINVANGGNSYFGASGTEYVDSATYSWYK